MNIRSESNYVISLTENEIFDLIMVLERSGYHSAETYHVLEDKAWKEWVVEDRDMKHLKFLSGLIGRLDIYEHTLLRINEIYKERKEKQAEAKKDAIIIA